MYDELNKRIEKVECRCFDLERDSHPPIGLCEFEGFKELVSRIDAIEEKLEQCMNIMLKLSKS